MALAYAGAACDNRFEGAGELRAAKASLQREVEGLRETVTRLERHETMLPLEDVAIAVEGALIRDIIDAQLPFDADIDIYHLRLSRADVTFQDSPILHLGGSLYLRANPSLSADVTAVGAFQEVVIDKASSMLSASIVVDYIAIERLAGLESVLSGALLDELARTVRIQIADQLPTIQIPVKVQQTIELPRMVAGPIRLDAASLPLRVSVSRVVAGRGQLWIAVQIKPGDFAKEVRR
jgi:hypothetical protein